MGAASSDDDSGAAGRTWRAVLRGRGEAESERLWRDLPGIRRGTIAIVAFVTVTMTLGVAGIDLAYRHQGLALGMVCGLVVILGLVVAVRQALAARRPDPGGDGDLHR